MRPRERIDYTPITDREPLKFPGDTRLVVWPVVNVEDWDVDKAMARTVLPPPGGKGLVPDIPNWAWHEYGMRVGFWRLKAALDSFDIRATLSINGAVCENYPALTGAARDAGWEFMAHAYVQGPMHLIDDQPAEIRHALDVIERFTGKRSRGWLGPGLTETFETLDHLAAEGVEYVGDWVLDDQPCVLATRHGPVVSIPYSLELNDISIMLVQHHKAAELYDRTMDQFERLYADGEATARVMCLAVHPYITGVPHRIRYFEEALRAMSERPGVAFWTGEEILDWYRAAQAG